MSLPLEETTNSCQPQSGFAEASIDLIAECVGLPFLENLNRTWNSPYPIPIQPSAAQNILCRWPAWPCDLLSFLAVPPGKPWITRGTLHNTEAFSQRAQWGDCSVCKAGPSSGASSSEDTGYKTVLCSSGLLPLRWWWLKPCFPIINEMLTVVSTWQSPWSQEHSLGGRRKASWALLFVPFQELTVTEPKTQRDKAESPCLPGLASASISCCPLCEWRNTERVQVQTPHYIPEEAFREACVVGRWDLCLCNKKSGYVGLWRVLEFVFFSPISQLLFLCWLNSKTFLSPGRLSEVSGAKSPPDGSRAVGNQESSPVQPSL